MSDIRVLGLVMGTHLIEDIQMDVPYGTTVIVAAEKAARSKDLWRGISQRCLFQLPSAAAPTVSTRPAVVPDQENDRLQALEDRHRVLEEENRRLRSALQTASAQQDQKLDAILAALQGGGFQAVQGQASPGRVSKAEVADGAAPTFIPSEIKPKDAEARIEARKEEAPSEVANSAERLRRLRKGSQ
jgi:hypothetical protein